MHIPSKRYIPEIIQLTGLKVLNLQYANLHDAGLAHIKELTTLTITRISEFPLNGVCFVPHQQGWAVGAYNRILYTPDGGRTWIFQYSGTDATLNQVFFADAQNGLIVGDDGVILTTTDGGAKWESQKNNRKNDLYGFALSPDGMLAVGSGGITMRFTVETEQLPIQMPPLAEKIEMVESKPIIEEVVYPWEIVRQATWRTDFADV